MYTQMTLQCMQTIARVLKKCNEVQVPLLDHNTCTCMYYSITVTITVSKSEKSA